MRTETSAVSAILSHTLPFVVFMLTEQSTTDRPHRKTRRDELRLRYRYTKSETMGTVEHHESSGSQTFSNTAFIMLCKRTQRRQSPAAGYPPRLSKQAHAPCRHMISRVCEIFEIFLRCIPFIRHGEKGEACDMGRVTRF